MLTKMIIIKFLLLVVTIFSCCFHDLMRVDGTLQMGKCNQRMCKTHSQCQLNIPIDRYPFLQYCSEHNLRYVTCSDCRFNENEISLNVQVTGITDHTNLLAYSDILMGAVNDYCPKLGCHPLDFATGPEDHFSTSEFFSLKGKWKIGEPTLMADIFHTRLYFIKIHNNKVVGALHPADITKLLNKREVIEALQQFHLTVQVKYVKSHNIFNEEDIIVLESGGSSDSSDQHGGKSNEVSSRATILILFGVLVVCVFLSLFLFRIKQRCLNRQHRVITRDTTSTPRVVIESIHPQQTTATVIVNQANTVVDGDADIMHPPPYTEDDEYKKCNPPPPYSVIVVDANGHQIEEENVEPPS